MKTAEILNQLVGAAMLAVSMRGAARAVSRPATDPWRRLAAPLLAVALAAGASELPAQGNGVRDRALEDVVTNALRNQMTPGAVVALVHRDSLVLLQAFGRTALDPEGARLPADAVFHAAAASELVNALTAILLDHAGVVDLAAPLKGIPALPPELNAVTIEQLLAHTGGVAYDVAIPGRGGADDLGAAARRLTRFDRLTDPGVIYSFSAPGIALAALALETRARTRYPVLVRRTLFQPLGMSGSGYSRAEVAAALTPGWTASSSVDGPVRRAPASADSAVLMPVRGLYSTASDLARLMAAVLTGRVQGERVLPDPVVSALWKDRGAVPASDTRSLAGARLARWLERPRLRISGGHGGHSVLMELLPGDSVGVLVLANKEGVVLTPVTNFLLRRALGDNRVSSARQNTAVDSTVVDDLLSHPGIYENGSEELEIAAADGRPVLKSGGLVLPLVPLPDRAVGAVLEGRIGLVLHRVTDARGRPYIFIGNRALARRR